jgi:hypothetical protein
MEQAQQEALPSREEAERRIKERPYDYPRVMYVLQPGWLTARHLRAMAQTLENYRRCHDNYLRITEAAVATLRDAADKLDTYDTNPQETPRLAIAGPETVGAVQAVVERWGLGIAGGVAPECEAEVALTERQRRALG